MSYIKWIGTEFVNIIKDLGTVIKGAVTFTVSTLPIALLGLLKHSIQSLHQYQYQHKQKPHYQARGVLFMRQWSYCYKTSKKSLQNAYHDYLKRNNITLPRDGGTDPKERNFLLMRGYKRAADAMNQSSLQGTPETHWSHDNFKGKRTHAQQHVFDYKNKYAKKRHEYSKDFMEEHSFSKELWKGAEVLWDKTKNFVTNNLTNNPTFQWAVDMPPDIVTDQIKSERLKTLKAVN
eukprot:Pgem_evm1s9503